MRRVDGILFTHSHADHIMGLDEVRRFNVLQHARHRLLRGRADAERSPPQLRLRILSADRRRAAAFHNCRRSRSRGHSRSAGWKSFPIPLLHGRRPILGFRLGAFAYLTDCSAIPDASWPLLDGVRVLILDALRDKPHPTHFSVSEALDVVARLKPERTYFTHICHDLPHAATCARLPEGVDLAYDGLTLDV